MKEIAAKYKYRILSVCSVICFPLSWKSCRINSSREENRMESASSRFLKKNMAAVMTVVAFASLLIVWEAVARFTNAKMFLPPASEILWKFFESFTVPIGRHTMLVHIGVSLYRVGVAFFFATIAGIALGVSMG